MTTQADGTPASSRVRIFVPRDAAARSVGADEVAERIAAHAAALHGAAAGGRVQIVRTGSRGMLWLEPLVEVETAEGRVGYGPWRPRT
jgi:formate dehydrogenase iron-sulfur subunit